MTNSYHRLYTAKHDDGRWGALCVWCGGFWPIGVHRLPMVCISDDGDAA